jgi:hypothetical protein
MHRRALSIVCFAAVLCGLYEAAITVYPPTPQLAESNLIANQMRLERFFFDRPATAALTGSSITGRLLPEYFDGTALRRPANLGLDGASPSLGLQVCTERAPAPALVLVEACRLDFAAEQNEAELRSLMKGPAWRLAGAAAIFRAQSRPSTILYAQFKKFTDRHSRGAPRPEDAPQTPAGPPAPGWPDRQLRLMDLIHTLQRKGTAVAVFRVPHGAALSLTRSPDYVDEFCGGAGLRQFDTEADFVRAGIVPTYTDGLHMDFETARQAAQFLGKQVSEAALLPKL